VQPIYECALHKLAMPALSTLNEQFMDKYISSGDALPAHNDFPGWAVFWFLFGLTVIPVWPDTKIPAARWEDWLTGLSLARIRAYWGQFPTHHIGHIVGENYIVFDADTPETLATLVAAEKLHGMESQLVIGTTRGEHHYYRRDTTLQQLVKTDFPNGLDVLSGRKMVVLPPSTGKTLIKLGGEQ